MSEIEKEIDRVIQALHLPLGNIAKCDSATAEYVITEARERFVDGNPRSWWLSLRHAADVFVYPDNTIHTHLTEHIPVDQESCWFVPETEEETPPVYDLPKEYLRTILDECPFFEYYIIGKELDWLVIENDHNQLFVVRANSSL